MPYTKNTWFDDPAGNTPITAAKLNNLESQYEQVMAQSAAINSVGQATIMGLTNSYANIATHDDSQNKPFQIIGLGSSVGVGATLPDPDTQTPVQRLTALFKQAISPLGNVPFTVTNGSVNGTTITSGQQTDYAAAKTAAGKLPQLVVLAYGMNDGMPEQYHRGQTFPGVYANGKTLVQSAQNDGSDVIIFTTPHPRTDIMTDSFWALSGTSQYPSATPIPATTQSGSTVSITTRSGATVQASYRHLRVNAALRRLAADTGAILIDVEQYWFDALATYGFDALFNTNEYAHPNLLGHQQSYWRAIDDFVKSLSNTTVGTTPSSASTSTVITYRFDNTAFSSTTTLADDNQLSVTVGANQVWEIELGVYYTGSVGDLRIGLSLPAGSGGRIGVHGPSLDAGGNGSHPMTSRSVVLPDTYGLPVGANDADSFALTNALVRTGSTGGVIKPKWCQDTSSTSATTIYRDTFMKARRVA